MSTASAERLVVNNEDIYEDDEDEVVDRVDDSDRHPTLDGLCAKLHAILVGKRAEELLADVDSLPDNVGVWVAPSWVWLWSRVNVGRKDRAADGSKLRLPVRVDWSMGPIVFVDPSQPTAYNWSAAGLGHGNAGSFVPEASPHLFDTAEELTEAGLPSRVRVPVLPRAEVVANLRSLAEEGRVARWQALEYLEPYAHKALVKAQSSVAYEMAQSWGTHRAVLDETKLETIRDQMLLGSEDHPGKVAQLLDRCLRPETFHRVEPLKYIKESLRRDANTEIRRAIGDPHIGAKIRRVSREIDSRDIDKVVEEYRLRYPKDRLSRDRAEAALSVAPDAMASWWELPAFDNR